MRYRRAKDPEIFRLYERQQRLKNPEVFRERDKARWLSGKNKKRAEWLKADRAKRPWIYTERARRRKLYIKRATPKWLTKEQRQEIINIYHKAYEITRATGIKHHVDHIIPLNGDDVCGLHVPYNLQILTASENLRKSNRFIPAS